MTVAGSTTSGATAAAAASVRARFTATFERERPHVSRFVARLGVAPSDLEDVTQEVFVSALRRFPDYDSRLAPRPWLFAFDVRCAANYRRLARHRRECNDDALDTLPLCATAALTPEEEVLAEERRQLVWRAVRHIPERRRAVFVLHDLEQLTAREIAQILGVGAEAVYSRLRGARREFRRALDQQLGDRRGRFAGLARVAPLPEEALGGLLAAEASLRVPTSADT